MSSKSLKLLLLSCLFSSSAAIFAAPPNTPVLDGRPLEYDASELVGTNPITNNFGSGNVITNLYVTWDENYLYIALQGQENDNKLAVLIDADPGNGTGASTTTNWSSPQPGEPDGKNHIRFNDAGWRVATNESATAFGLDYMVTSEGLYNNYVRVLYDGIQIPETNTVITLFDFGNGPTPQGGPIDVVVQADATINPLKGFESRISWSNFYINSGRFGVVNPGNVVPLGATIRVFAVLHNNNPTTAHSTDGIIPNQTSVNSSYADYVWTTDDYIDVVIDGNNDGFPDVAAGDVNAPYLKYVSGVQGKRQVYAWFNEEVTALTIGDILNWQVDGSTPESVTILQSDAVFLNLTNDLPAAGTLVRVTATGVEDDDGNSKSTFNYFNPSTSGTETSITVRFLLNINSGFGAAAANPRATNFFVNGANAPLELGSSPIMSSPLTSLNATQHYRDVTFPAGSSIKINYKYSGKLTGGGLATGTNTYEAIRLDNYHNPDLTRVLTLPTNGITSLVVTDWLGAVGAPFRNPNTNTGYNAVYTDTRRGDAGVRQRTTILFQLDLSERNLSGVTRVLLQGTDPLRGFNFTSSEVADYAGTVGWADGGITMVDNGTLGDLIASDGIYSRLWAFSTNGEDAIIEPSIPNSLVGGNDFTPPYFGSGWLNRRSPRSFKYKFFVYRESFGTALDSPDADIEYYIENTSATNIVFEPFVWADNELPLPPPSNSPNMQLVVQTAGVARVVFTNQLTELQHGVEISTNLMQGWLNYGTRASTTLVSGVWQANIGNNAGTEHYRAFAGPPKPFFGAQWEPNPIPLTGATLKVYYRQHSRALAGVRTVQISGVFNGWSQSPMTFLGDGTWYTEVVIAPTNVPIVNQFKFRAINGSPFYGYNDSTGDGNSDNYHAYQGDLRATWTPAAPTNNQEFSITYNAAGGPFTNATAVNAWLGFGEPWGGSARPMTNISGMIWHTTIVIPSNALHSVNFVFNGTVGAGTLWDSENDSGGRRWQSFIVRPEE